MDTPQQNNAPQYELPAGDSLGHSARPTTARGTRFNRGWRCFAGSLAILCGFVALNLAGCGGGAGSGLDGGFTGGDTSLAPGDSSPLAQAAKKSSRTVTIQVRDGISGELLPALAISDPNDPSPTPTSFPLSVRLTGGSYKKTVTFTDPQTGAVFSNVPAGTYKAFVDGQRSGPDIAVKKGGTNQNFQVIEGLNTGTKYLSKVTIIGRTLLSIPQDAPTVGPGTPVPTLTPTPRGACTDSDIATGPYLIRVTDFNRRQVVALYSKPSGTDRFQITNIPLPVTSGKPISSTFYIEIFADPSSSQTDFVGTSALFTIGAKTTSKGSSTLTIPDICAVQGTLVATPTPNGTATTIPTIAGTPSGTATPGPTGTLPGPAPARTKPKARR